MSLRLRARVRLKSLEDEIRSVESRIDTEEEVWLSAVARPGELSGGEVNVRVWIRVRPVAETATCLPLPAPPGRDYRKSVGAVAFWASRPGIRENLEPHPSRTHRFRCMRCWSRVPVALPKARQIRHHSSDSPTPAPPISKSGTTSGRGLSSMRRPTAVWLRAVAVLTFVATVALQTAEKAVADPGATDVITVAAVDANGLPANGYQVLDRQSWPDPLTCPVPSPAAVGNNIYSCEPSSAIAEVCWPAPGSVLCVSDPWSKALRRFPSPGALPAVEPPAIPMPFALLLDDGTRCVLPARRRVGRPSRRPGPRVRLRPGHLVARRPDPSRPGPCVGDRPLATAVEGAHRPAGPAGCRISAATTTHRYDRLVCGQRHRLTRPEALPRHCPCLASQDAEPRDSSVTVCSRSGCSSVAARIFAWAVDRDTEQSWCTATQNPLISPVYTEQYCAAVLRVTEDDHHRGVLRHRSLRR